MHALRGRELLLPDSTATYLLRSSLRSPTATLQPSGAPPQSYHHGLHEGSQRRERGTPLHAALSVLQIPTTQTVPGHAVPSQAPPVPDTQTSSSDDSVFTSADWANVLKGYRSQYIEHDFWVQASMIEGAIPHDLEGTLLRNGPGLFEIGGIPVSQPFDGDGMVSSWAIKDGRCYYRNRYVRTDAFMAEQEAGRMLFKGAFSRGDPAVYNPPRRKATQNQSKKGWYDLEMAGPKPVECNAGGGFFNPFNMDIKQIANTNALHWAGRIFALHERDLPWELDSSLQTVGRTDLEGTVGAVGKPNFGSHFRIFTEDDGSKRLVGTSFDEDLRQGKLTFFEYNERMELLYRTTAELPGAGFGFFHDIAMSENYYIALENPISMDFSTLLLRYMTGRACLAECLKYDPKKRTKIHLIPRPGRAGSLKQVVLECGPFFCFHHVNAYEDASGNVTLDCIAMHGGVDFSMNFSNLSHEFFAKPPWRTSLTRLSLNPITAAVETSILAEKQSLEMPCVAPSLVGRPHRHAYFQSSRVAQASNWGAPQDLLKVSLSPEARGDPQMQRWSPGRDSFCQEPIFVPRPQSSAEDDGWILAPVFRSATSTTDLVILDAQELSKGPIATIHLPHHIPIGLHGSFTHTYLGPQPRSETQPRQHDIRNGVSDRGRPVYS